MRSETVKRAIANASQPARGELQPGEENNTSEGDSESREWKPHPLAAKVEPEPYPLDALPDKIRAAVEEVVGFRQSASSIGGIFRTGGAVAGNSTSF